MTKQTFTRATLLSAIGFAAASFLVFLSVACCERWMYQHLTPGGAYLAWTLIFIVLGGLAFKPTLNGKMSLARFLPLFAGAFFLYAIGWTAAYFILRGKAGEWLGSLAGSILMALVFALGFRALRSLLKLAAILFIANSLGYFLGSSLNDTLHGASGMLLWGVVYGLFLGGGIAVVIQLAREQ